MIKGARWDLTVEPLVLRARQPRNSLPEATPEEMSTLGTFFGERSRLQAEFLDACREQWNTKEWTIRNSSHRELETPDEALAAVELMVFRLDDLLDAVDEANITSSDVGESDARDIVEVLDRPEYSPAVRAACKALKRDYKRLLGRVVAHIDVCDYEQQPTLIGLSLRDRIVWRIARLLELHQALSDPRERVRTFAYLKRVDGRPDAFLRVIAKICIRAGIKVSEGVWDGSRGRTTHVSRFLQVVEIARRLAGYEPSKWGGETSGNSRGWGKKYLTAAERQHLREYAEGLKRPSDARSKLEHMKRVLDHRLK